jgi:ABC-type dipeptide/oligopeptide/nickel transport system permease component
MARFATRRLMTMLLVLIVISIVTFLLFIVALPGGNPAAQIAGRLATPTEVHLISVRYGFDKPIWVQYVKTMANIFDGGAVSYSQGYNVLSQIGKGFPATLSLALGAGIFWLLASIALGTLAAVRSGKYTDRVLTVLAMVGVSMPPFLLGAVLTTTSATRPVRSRSGTTSPSMRTRRAGSGTCWHRGSRSRSCSSASTRGSCAVRSSTRWERTTCARRGPRVCPSAGCWSGTCCG